MTVEELLYSEFYDAVYHGIFEHFIEEDKNLAKLEVPTAHAVAVGEFLSRRRRLNDAYGEYWGACIYDSVEAVIDADLPYTDFTNQLRVGVLNIIK